MTAQRLLLLMFAVLIVTGIGLTGFGTAYGFLYVPLAALWFCGVAVVCTGSIIIQKMGFA